MKEKVKKMKYAEFLVEYSKQPLVLSLKEMEEILEGKEFEKYKKIISGLSLGNQWLLIKYLCALLCEKEEVVKEEDCYEISNRVNHLVTMIEAVKRKEILSQILYQEMNESLFLPAVVSCVRVENYLVLNERYLGNIVRLN